ncbi:MAG: methyltransferase domain-containing protein [Deltaproteobacteria bacterium]|nr:methyltransferase domain-containing protein [Deltaproteobacteria bacterium]
MSSRKPKEQNSTQREDDSATGVDGSLPGTGDSSTGAGPLLDYATVSRYWSKAKPSIMGPYMMDGFGFPASAGSYRFDAECEIVERLIRSASIQSDGTVLDLGSGVGFWAEYFAQRFDRVIALEASVPLYEAMVARCSQYSNATLLNDDVLGFEPEGRYSMIFLGGMLMYLNESDVIALLERVTPFLEPGGIVLCRESTVRSGTLTRQGDYQVVYRSVQSYSSLFSKCGLSVDHVELNTPYFLMQMGCEFIKQWKAMVPGPLQAIPVVGGLTYRLLRMGGAGLTRLPDALGIDFPELTNHFFVLRRDSEVQANALP